ncbi:MAG: MarR family transcriptional regulator [Akkermansia sp.]|nr:MarR family transcriptional regulator [Akkermansia sp.]
MKPSLTNKSNLSADEAQHLADFIMFSQRNCILKLSPELTQDKVSYPQFFLLTYLAEEESLSMSSIARMMGHSTAAATGMVDKLQELGHLKRFTAAADRRKIMVRITDQGRELIERMRGNIARDLANLMASEDNAERTDRARSLISRRTKSTPIH